MATLARRVSLHAIALARVMLTTLLSARLKHVAGRSFYHWRDRTCAISLQVYASRADRARERCYSMLQTNAMLNRQLKRIQSVVHQRSELICQFDGMLTEMHSPSYGTHLPQTLSAKDTRDRSRLHSSTAPAAPQFSPQNSTAVMHVAPR